jgi:fucose 4-O-acetylase-like acetyltransferase
MTKSNQNKSLLLDVSILRPVLIVLLVFYHAFAIYSGAWKPISGFPEVKFYWWLDKLSYASMLETFVFMSGYVFGYQVRTKGDVKLEAKNLFLSKFKRLIIPSMIFSFLYILFFQGTTQSFISISYDIVNGVAHMWFLPMLFWCFVGVWVIEKMKLTPKLVLALLILCSIFWIVPLPFQMGETMYYLLFFYTGYLIQRVNVNMKLCYTPRFILIIFISFIVLFPSLTLFREHAEDIVGGAFSGDLIVKYVSYFLSNIAKLVYSTLGLFLLFIVV